MTHNIQSFLYLSMITLAQQPSTNFRNEQVQWIKLYVHSYHNRRDEISIPERFSSNKYQWISWLKRIVKLQKDLYTWSEQVDCKFENLHIMLKDK